jgi:hypothetical protein
MIVKNSKIPKLSSLVIDVYAITIWPFVFIRDEGDPVTINHEKIHLRQQIEMLLLGFYVLYSVFWLLGKIKGFTNSKAYYTIPFEKEAYENQHNFDYIENRKIYSWLRYL